MVRILHCPCIKKRSAPGAGAEQVDAGRSIERPATEELEMNAAKSKSAWVALLAAGGLYAWQNRDKIQGWLNTQRDQINSQPNSLPATGATQRIDSQDAPTSHRRGIYGTE